MRKLLVSLGVACLAVAAPALFAIPASKAPEKITINDCASKKPAVEFPHAQHFKTLECKTCHHTQADLKAGAATEVVGCKTCHVTPEKAETPKCSEMSSKTNPFHMVCVGCHKEELAKNADTKAPTKCDQCHLKT